jgi:NADH-quinone oxidoreductase subunit N
MLYGMSLLYGLTGTLKLPELAATLPSAPVLTVLAALGLVLVGYGFKVTLVPSHAWASDTYQGAPTPIAGYLAVGPKAAALAVLGRTVTVAFPDEVAGWPMLLAILAAMTMTLGNVLALRQESAKRRLLAYSSIAQAGYLLVGVAATSSPSPDCSCTWRSISS